MKNNIYVQHAEEIVAISKEKNVDMGVATDMFIADKCDSKKDFEAYKEWISMCNQSAWERKHILEYIKEHE